MIQSIIHSSENGNLYIYDTQRRLSMLVHPEFKKACEKSSEVNLYYLKKYLYLKKYGFFTESKSVDFLTMKESMVEKSFIDTPQIVFETTDLCNLNCTYCALGELYDGFDERIGKKINTTYAVNLIKYVFDLKPKIKNKIMYISFYGGEALLNIEFIRQIVDVVNQLNVKKEFKIVYSMTTNATLIDKYVDFLVLNDFRLLISLDGNEKNHSYRVFGKSKKNSFYKVIRNMDMIKRDYPLYFSENISFNAVLHDRNSVKEICEFIYNKYNKIPRISELNTRDIKVENKDILRRMFHRKRESEVEFIEKSALSRIAHEESSFYNDLVDFLKYYSINCYISNINSLLCTEEKYLPTNTCIPFSKKIFMTSRNKLLPCEKMNYLYYMGSVNENVEIDFSKIVQKYNFYYDHLKKICQSCYAYRFCGTCLFHMINIDRIGTEEFVCDNFCDQNSLSKKLYYTFSFLEKYPADLYKILEDIIIE
ncbi:radical SAM peptide maturase [Parabacteroides johnsonii]|uniref:radical SAM peptide maturase n=1 Tax=Parabacteroides johnsonii TaxID=387661 RepID=UPI00242BF38A|nr:radical SAM peptide maturase [Parabacteroides johnsonii]MBS6225576.1 radical SAM peptide maturase [Parabacteroides johnsonii]